MTITNTFNISSMKDANYIKSITITYSKKTITGNRTEIERQI